MAKQQVSLREFKSKFDRYIHDVENGAAVVASRNGRQVARIIPEAEPAEQKRAALKCQRDIRLERPPPEEQKAIGAAETTAA